MSTPIREHDAPDIQGVDDHALDRLSGVVPSPVRPAPRWLGLGLLGAGAVLTVALAMVLHPALAGVAGYLIFLLGTYVVFRVVSGARVATDRVMRALMYGAFILALLPLVSVMWTVIGEGAARAFNPDFLQQTMNGVTGVNDMAYAQGTGDFVGGAYHAIIGTIIITALASLISIPIGLFTAIYLVEYSAGNKLSHAIRFLVDVMTGIPSIVAGLFAFALWATLFGIGTKNALGGAVALAVLMIPTVVRNSEEMLRIVPNELREAALALGVPKWRVIAKVVLPTAASGLASGITLAIARVIGETAPLLVAVGFTHALNTNPTSGPMNSLALFAYQMFTRPLNPGVREPSLERAWAAALLLVLLVVVLNLGARLIAKLFAPKTGR